MVLNDLMEHKISIKIHNFSAGPCILPNEVMLKAAESVVDFNGIGLSILEISHRSSEFIAVLDNAKSLVKEILNVPDNYSILFLQGGASTQFCMVPQNLLKQNGQSAYLDTGVWAKKAIKESKKFGETRVISSSKDKNYSYYPKDYHIPNDVDYFHITSNNTIYGTQIKEYPDCAVPLVCDMSSDIFSKPIDVSKFDLIYAGAQKNLGPAGATLVIIKNDLLKKADQDIPSMLDYRNHIEKESMFNTPPCFSIYVSMLTLEWIKNKGGIEVMKQRSEEKAKLLYSEIERNTMFEAVVKDKVDQSNMNITFVLKDADLELSFLTLAEQHNIRGIKGHRSTGGFRASIYNAMEIESVQALVNCMREFENNY
jgi:phosphoserine aminotransferase